MKPVEDVFSADAFRRIIMPGIILALGIHPLALGLLPFLGLYGVGAAALMVAEIIIFGLLVSSAIQVIYYVYEGFALEPLTRCTRRMNQARLDRLNRLATALRSKQNLTPVERQRRDVAFEKLTDYPLRQLPGGSTEYYVESATRLGNIIATYELYAETRYGVDGVFFWFHLLALAPENLRKEFGEQYAFSESLVLASFSGALVALVHLLILLGFGVGKVYPRIAIPLSFGPSTSSTFIMVGVLASLLFYWASLPAHKEAGKILQSIVDSVMPGFIEWLVDFKAPLRGETLSKLEKVRRYLAEPSNT
jgi:hypothetical protein